MVAEEPHYENKRFDVAASIKEKLTHKLGEVTTALPMTLREISLELGVHPSTLSMIVGPSFIERTSVGSKLDTLLKLGVDTIFDIRVSYPVAEGGALIEPATVKRSQFGMAEGFPADRSEGKAVTKEIRAILGQALRHYTELEGVAVKSLAEELDVAATTVSSMMSPLRHNKVSVDAVIDALQKVGAEVELEVSFQKL